jgi:phosphoribosylaminoimidazole (AIR) synthetase
VVLNSYTPPRGVGGILIVDKKDEQEVIKIVAPHGAVAIGSVMKETDVNIFWGFVPPS